MVNTSKLSNESVTPTTVATTTKDIKDGKKSSLLSPTNEKKKTKKSITTTTSSSSSSRTTKKNKRKDLSSNNSRSKSKSVTNHRRISFSNIKQQSQKRPRSLSDESTSSRSCSSDSSCSTSSSNSSSVNSSVSSSNSILPKSVKTIKMAKNNDNLEPAIQLTTDNTYDMEINTDKNLTTALPATTITTTITDENNSDDKSRRSIAEKHIKTITSKTKTGKHDLIDGFAFLSFENNDDLLLAYEQHQQLLIAHNKHKINERNRITIGRKTSRKTDQSSIMIYEANRSMNISCNPTIKVDIAPSSSNTPLISSLDDSKPFIVKNNQQQLDKFDDDSQQQIPKHTVVTPSSELNKEQRAPLTIKSEPNLFDYSQFKQFPPFSSSPFGPSLPFDPMIYSRFYNPHHNFELPIPPPPLFSSGPALFRPYPKSDESPNTSSSSSVNLSLEKMLSSFYPTYISAATAAATNTPSSASINVKMDPTNMCPNLWSRETLQRQLNSHYLASHHNQNSFQQPQADKLLTQPKSDVSPTQFSSTTKVTNPSPKPSNSTSSTDFTPLPYHLPPLIFTEFHQHQHNHNHTHQHNLNLTTKNDSLSKSPAITPNSTVTKEVPSKKPSSQTKMKFSVSEMFTNDNHANNNSTVKRSNELSSRNHAFLSVNKSSVKNSCPPAPTIKPSNGRWSSAHVHIAWMIYYQEQRVRDKFGLTSPNKQQNPAMNTLRPPFLSFDAQSALFSSQNDLNARNNFSPWMAQSFKSLPPFLPHQEQSPLLRPPFAPVLNKSSSSTSLTLPCPKPIVTSSTTIKQKRDSEIKHQAKPITIDITSSRTTPLPTPTFFDSHITNATSLLDRRSLSLLVPNRSTPVSTHLLSSPSLRLQQQQNKDLFDERRKFNQEQLLAFPPSPFLSSLLTNPAASNSSMPPFNRPTTSTSYIDYKPSLSPYFPTPSSLFDPSTIGTRAPPFLPDRLEQERYRYLLEQQAQLREREVQMMMTAVNHPLSALHQSLSTNDERIRFHERLYKPY
ncbi:unnamed protein product [Didymodactylos carnosus]|uniref:Uncharacterized protein n=1 Tax=Didymodactylos carnosus TaxID=1234261 RepID=A0A8S2J6E4_9BILA|nr:unnamed protein product [Didymodactylos carnosus]CAF3794392.1 unnamed protein product [Didymodactylos carnosus]